MDDWYVLVTIRKDHADLAGQTELEQYAQDVADSVHPPHCYVSTCVAVSVGTDDKGKPYYRKPSWAKDHVVEEQHTRPEGYMP